MSEKDVFRCMSAVLEMEKSTDNLAVASFFNTPAISFAEYIIMGWKVAEMGFPETISEKGFNFSNLIGTRICWNQMYRWSAA